MKYTSFSFLLALTCFFYFPMDFQNTQQVSHAERQTPSYAKWGSLAVQRTSEKYPNAKIVDYLHIGRENRDSTTVEKFKLWLKAQDKEFGVIVTIEFTNDTEQLKNITFEEVTR